MEEAGSRCAEGPVGSAHELVDRGERAITVFGKCTVQSCGGGIGARAADVIVVNVSEITLRGLGCPPESLADELALAMLGIGRETVRRFARDDVGNVDLPAMEAALRDLGGAPAIIVGNAGEVNAGGFDPIDALAELAERYEAWLHVDGAFGLFARVTPKTAHLAKGVERAHSVISDGHKWLNVPYDSGFAFVRDASLLAGAFAIGAAYLPKPGEHPMFGGLGPEASRRARGIAIWATLRAYGRTGYREMVERHLDLAQHLAHRVDDAPDLERLAEVPLNIVCFRYRPKDAKAEELDSLNLRLGAELLADGRVYVGTTRYRGVVALRPAIVNWRTSEADVDLLVDVVRELGMRLGVAAAV